MGEGTAMTKVAVYFMSLAQGVALAALLGWLLHLVWPLGGWIVFWGISACWLWIGWRYAQTQDAARGPSSD
jgi:uncharacterized membrane protein